MRVIDILYYLLGILMILSVLFVFLNFCLFIYWKFKNRKTSNFKNIQEKRLKSALYGILVSIVTFATLYILGNFFTAGSNPDIHWGKNIICGGVKVNGKCIGEEYIMYVDPGPQ
jgi:hypothetical protein